MKKITAILSAMAVIAGSVPMYANAYSCETTGRPYNSPPVVDWNKWDDFIKYDLRITDFYSLDREKQDLCKFIFETEMSSPEDIVCERARRIVAGQNVGERADLEKLNQYEGIVDSKLLYGLANTNQKADSVDYDFNYEYEDKRLYFCVPDIKHVGFEDYNEYWLDDEGTEYIISDGDAEIIYDDFSSTFEYINRQEDDCRYIKVEEIPEYPVISYNEFEFTVYPDNTLSLEKVDYDKNDSDVIEVPAIVDGMPVKQIASKCFENAPYTEIILPEGLEYIEPLTFIKCNNLETVNFPDSLKNIGAYAFSFCENLGTLEISCPDIITTQFNLFDTCSVDSLVIGTEKQEYYYCDGYFHNNFGNITFLDGVKEIDVKYLQDDIEIPESVTVISGHVFEDKNKLVIPKQIEILGAFDDIRPHNPYISIGIGGYPQVPLYNKYYGIIPSGIYVKMYGYRNTEAEKYALAHDYLFYPLDDDTPPDTSEPDEDKTSGDANGDGKINIADAVLLQRYLLGNAELSGNADANQDGVVDIFDMVYIRKLLID
ncbi:MAG: leucine-rich repeat protein [Ruminococcus sp.]|nr:leucine-rich repeat protein [Ruminococcus sp.]